jgi:PAS domain S-box-containing protein
MLPVVVRPDFPPQPVSSESTRTEGGTGALAALLASLQPALAAEHMRLARGKSEMPRWFAPIAPVVSGECIEILALDGTVLFVSDSDALPADRVETADPQPGFWLRHANPDASGALALAGQGQTAKFQAMAETRDGDLVRWDVTVTPMHTQVGEVDALLVVSRHDMPRQREQILRQREQKLRLREQALEQREALNRQEDTAALRDALERLDLALSAGPVIGTWVWDVQADRVIADARLARAFSIPPDQVAAGLPLASFLGMIHPDDREWVRDLIAETTRLGGDFRAEYRLVYADRPAHWVQASGRCEMDEDGQPRRFPGVLVDVHDRVELQRAAQAKAERQAALLTLGDQLRDAPDAAAIAALSAQLAGKLLGASNVGYADVDPQIGRITIRHDWTDGVAASIAGTYDSTSVGSALDHLRRGLPIVEEDLWSAAWMDPADRETYRAMGMRGLVTLPLLRDGRLVGTMFVGSADRRVWQPDEVRFVRDVADRTWAAIERVQGEAALRAGAAELRLVADSMPVLITQVDRDLVFRFCNRASIDWFGLPPEQIVGQTARAIFGPEGFAWRQRYFDAALAGKPSQVEVDWPHRDGAPRAAQIRYLPRRDARGGNDGFYAFVLDITDHKRAEQQLLGSAEALEAEIVRRTADRDRMWHLSTDIMLVAHFEGGIEALNPAWGALLGWQDSELLGSNFFGLVHPDDQAATRAKVSLLLAGQRIPPLQNRLRHQDGSYRWISWSMVPDERFLHAAGRDVTAERDGEVLQRQLEEQLRQSQKMEAVGQLTGGLAHDFNNLLTGISGSLELLQARLARGQVNDLGRYIQAAQGSAQRAAALTHRLLAFSRRQTLDPKPTDVNQLVDSLAELINGTVGPAIEVTTLLGDDLWSTLCDPNQLENALLNLCINARDAMPAGGRLVIETTNASLDELAALDSDMAPGDYVTVSVSDTGTGMTAEVAARAFDPFYTTKKLGEGTGLGLSMIYGFVKQSGGQIRVYTEVGRGTTMQLFLPRHQAAAAAEPSSHTATQVRAKRGETVLLVDDEPTIRDLVLEVLQELGYDAIGAEDAASALAILQSDRRFDLLISDVGLPGGMNGRELADLARQDHPALKVLFVTGYAANAVVGNGALSAGMHIMTKPFTVNGLAAKIRAVLAED